MRPMTLRPADRVSQSQALFQNLRTKRSKSNFKIHNFTFAVQGNQGRAQDTAKITTRRKSSEWSAFWKNLLRRYYGVRRLPDNSFLVLLCSLSSSFLELAKGFEPPTL